MAKMSRRRARIRTIYRNVVQRVIRRRSRPRKKSNNKTYITIGILILTAVLGFKYKDQLKGVFTKSA